MNNYDTWAMLQDCGIWLAFFAFGMASGVFVTWLEKKVEAHNAN